MLPPRTRTKPKRTKTKPRSEDAEKTDSQEDKKEEKKKRKTAKVETKRLKVDVTLDGTFTAEKMTPVALRPEAWTQFEIVEIVEHGSEVHEGQMLVKFDTEKIDEEIADLELQSARQRAGDSQGGRGAAPAGKDAHDGRRPKPSATTKTPTRISTATTRSIGR